ncbi:MAG: cytochrome b/b6 domain-containing protein [Geitlerinemataceae cyanobacterium]
MSTSPTTRPRLNSAFKHLMSLHWVMSVGYLVLFTTGPVMARLPREVVIRNPLYDFHKSMGALVLGLLTWRILVLLRVWWRKYIKRMPKRTKKWYQAVALHTTLYVFMWVVPVTGFFFSNSFKSNNVHLFGILLPDLFPQNSELVNLGRNLHFWFSYTFLCVIILHMLVQRKVVRSLWRRFVGWTKVKFQRS